MAKHSTFSSFTQLFSVCAALLCGHAVMAQKPTTNVLAGDYAGTTPPGVKLSETEKRYTAAHLSLKADGSYSLTEMFDKLPYSSAGRWQSLGSTLTLNSAATNLPPNAKLERSLPKLPKLINKNDADSILVHSGGVNKSPALSTPLSAIKNQAGLILVRVTDVANNYVYSGIRVNLVFNNDQPFTANDLMQMYTDGLGRFYYQLAPGQQIKSISLGISESADLVSPTRICRLAGGRSGGVSLGGDPQKKLGTFVANPAMQFFDFSFAPNRMNDFSQKTQVLKVINGKLVYPPDENQSKEPWVFSKGKSAIPACLS
jgi:hypothetical protein